MHLLFAQADSLTGTIIAGAIEVHRQMGPGLMESTYEWCLMRELELRKLSVTQQRSVPITYKGFVREEQLRIDLLVEACVLVEIKAVERIMPIQQAQVMTYLKLLLIPIGLLINFHEPKPTTGISRLILPGANR